MLRIPFAATLATLAFVSAASAQTNWEQTIGQYSTVSIIAGAGAVNNGSNEWNNADGLPATQAELSEPHSAMADIYGNVFIADRNAEAIRKITPDGIIHTVLGTGATGDGPDGPALQCALNAPQNAYVLPDGTFYVLENGNDKVRRVDRNGNATTVFTDPNGVFRGLWVSRNEQVIYYTSNTTLRRWTPANGAGPGELMASGFAQCGNIDVAADGAIFVTDRNNNRVYRIESTASNIFINNFLTVAGMGGSTDDGRNKDGAAAVLTGLREVRGIAFHPLGGYFLATHRGGDIWYVDTNGNIHMVIEGNNSNASIGGSIAVPTTPADGIVLASNRSISVALNGDLLIACNDAGFIRRVTNIVPKPAAPVYAPSEWIPGQGLRINWQSAPGDWQFIESSEDLINWSFSTAFPGPVPGGAVQWTDPNSLTAPKLFHRIRAFRAWPN